LSTLRAVQPSPRWCLAVVLLVAVQAFAQAPVPARLEPVDAPVAEAPHVDAPVANASAVGLRLVAIRVAVAAEVPRVRLWRWSWTALYAALTVGQLVPIPWVDDGTKIDMVVGAASSAIGALLLIFFPLDVQADEARYAAFPATAAGLADAERLLHHDAADEDFNRSWVFHAGNVLFNAAIGLVLGLGWKRWESAAISFGVGVVVGEAMILTQPHMLADVSRAGGPPPVTLAPFLVPGGGGLALAGRF
jgi:hypothetical protein